MQMWFVLKGETVVGPIGSDKVLASYSDQNVLVWGVSCAEWMSFSEWSQQFNAGSFSVVESHIAIKPFIQKKDESKVFKVRPHADVMTTPDFPSGQNESSEASVDEAIGDLEETKFQDLSAMSKSSEASPMPLPSIPSVDDIFPSDIQQNSQNGQEVSDALNDKLSNFLQESSFNDGNTLIQATMDDLNHELEAEAQSDEASENFDGATMVQGSPSIEALDLESDGATIVQGSPSMEDFNLESDGATMVQGSPSIEALDLESDGATIVQSSPSMEDFNLESDGATMVQGSPSIEELDLESDGATIVQSSPSMDDFILDTGSVSDQQSEFEDQASDIFSMDDLNNVSHTQTAHNTEDSLGEFNLEGLAETNSAEHSLGEFTLESLGEESVLLVEQLNNVIPLHPVVESVQSEVNLDSPIDLENANVAGLKEVAQQIEQSKAHENPVWYVAYDGVSEGPINVEALLKKLDSFENPEFIYIWKKGFADWQNLFDTPQISSQLGIGFRRHERFSFAGTVKIEFNGNIQIGQLENLSVSGIGATGFGPLVLGETVKVTLDCTDLDSEIEFIAKIRFTSELGVLGLSFVKSEYSENINKIIELVQVASARKAA